MKYVIISADTEEPLIEVNDVELPKWKVSFEQNHVNLLQGSQHYHYPLYHEQDQVKIATHLGSLRFFVQRGGIVSDVGLERLKHKTIKSSMPGKVIHLLCKKGDEIALGQPLLVLEAMKMENEIRSPHAGVIEDILVEAGQKVESGELLIKLGTK